MHHTLAKGGLMHCRDALYQTRHHIMDPSKSILYKKKAKETNNNKTKNKHKKTRCVCETLMPPKYPSFEKHDPDI